MKENGKPESLMEKFFRLQMLLHRQQIMNLRAYGPYGSPVRGQGRILSILKMQPTISQKQLSYLLDMRQQSLSELLAKLEKSGLIERTQSDDDRRAVVIALTDKGREASDDADSAAPDPDKAFECLSEMEQAQLALLMDKLIESLDDRPDGPREDFRRPFGPMHARGFGSGPFSPRGPFGPEGGFGPEGEFGPGGPFGPWDRCGHEKVGHRGECGRGHLGEGREEGCQGEHHRERHGEGDCRGDGHFCGGRGEFHGHHHPEDHPFGARGPQEERRGDDRRDGPEGE